MKDEGDAKYYLVELIRKAQIEHKLGEEPMLIIDGIPVYYHYRKDFVSIKIIKDQIKEVRITESSKCVSLYGSACKYGLITLKTYSGKYID
ncbi:hypothetical protein N0B16_10615 [Chryseobacterium sp. GMJ5]|uniref:Transposase n=1 Tax=Chryseobacterium gilvum TaxID=2976534 RepID=A0ABT2VY08_9FLAO|nr:hypothetical protein [Chryseobacterium gilvum]